MAYGSPLLSKGSTQPMAYGTVSLPFAPSLSQLYVCFLKVVGLSSLVDIPGLVCPPYPSININTSLPIQLQFSYSDI